MPHNTSVLTSLNRYKVNMTILNELTGGDLRSDGKADEVAEKVLRNPLLLKELIEGLHSSDDVIKMRTAHALEYISRKNPELLEPVKPTLVNSASDTLPEVRWHLAQIFGNVPLSQKERDAVVSILFDYLDGESILVKAWSIESLGALAEKDGDIRDRIIQRIEPFQNDKSPAVRKRALKVVRNLTDGRILFPQVGLS